MSKKEREFKHFPFILLYTRPPSGGLEKSPGRKYGVNSQDPSNLEDWCGSIIGNITYFRCKKMNRFQLTFGCTRKLLLPNPSME